MPRLLILCEYPTLSGGERSMLGTLDGVVRAGFDVSVMAPPEGPLAEACAARGAPLIPFPSQGCHGHLARAGASATPTHRPCYTGGTPVAPRRLPLSQRREQLAHELARLRPDLLHANSLSMGRLAGPVAFQLGLPSVAHLRDIIRLSRRAAADLNRNTRLLAVSEATRRFHLTAGIRPEKTFVLYNGVDLDEFRPTQPTGYLHRELGIPPGSPLIGSIGQICLRKAQDVLLEAVVQLAGDCPDFCAAKMGLSPSPGATAGLPSSAEPHWLIVGERWSDKPESRRFDERLHELAHRLPGSIHFLGRRDDVPRLLGELTLLVHTARQEPLGRVLLEAAASGTPVVATDVGGTGEIFPPESGSARLIPPDDPAALGRAIGELLADPRRRATMAAAARRRAEAHFDLSRATAGLIEHYRALTDVG